MTDPDKYDQVRPDGDSWGAVDSLFPEEIARAARAPSLFLLGISPRRRHAPLTDGAVHLLSHSQLAKVEPLARALKELHVDAWINGRRRDHGAERAALPIFEEGTPVKVRLQGRRTRSMQFPCA